ncbi:MAG: hypothetical protein AAB038_02160 [Planctomycetota bacterium]
MKFISKLSQRERMYFYITAVIITLFLVDRFIFGMMLGQINQLDERISTLKDELANDKKIISSKDNINKESELYGKYLAKEENPDRELPKIINTLAIQSELINSELKPIPSKDGNRYLVELNAEGKMKNIVSFMYNLNMGHSLLKVEKIDLSPKAAKSETLKIYILISKAVVQ